METTLFLLQSIDGKISMGPSDAIDFDSDIPKLPGDASAGLYQYYDIEQTTSNWSLVTGKTQAKLGVNEKPFLEEQVPVNFVVVDSSHLTTYGLEYMMHWGERIVLATTKYDWGIDAADYDNLDILYYSNNIDFKDLFNRLETVYGVEKLTVQSGGSLNAELLRQGLIDNIDIVVSPLLVGGRDTPTLIDGRDLVTIEEVLRDVRTCERISVEKLKNSYLRLRYKVIN